MSTAAELIARGADRLAAAGETPRLDAELILAHALGITRAGLLARLREPVPDSEEFDSLIARREKGEPLAYLFGRWEFFSLEFEVEPPALVPRPETEHLVEAVIDFIGARPAAVLDLCTGTGCVAVSVAVNAPRARVVAVDVNPAYVALAGRNAARHGVGARVDVRQGDLFGAVKHGETFDAICANPPYVETGSWRTLSPTIRNFEDPAALLAGVDGLGVIRRIVAGAGPYLAPGGLLALEIGQGQAAGVRALFEAAAFAEVTFHRDLAGIERIAAGRRPPAGAGRLAVDAKEIGCDARL